MKGAVDDLDLVIKTLLEMGFMQDQFYIYFFQKKIFFISRILHTRRND